ncbi:hypothetical protein A3K63_04375 [Candidatus Micrarchaeota archaeon RBG_16_49_10]|nr:MAG: hypothetical protein A3K63_04375 [Candidatus Micrarchaeota archaeon RBG_16_49_10]
MSKKLFFIILDGAGGTPSKELGGKTSIEYAETPNLDFLAGKGKTGMIDVMGSTAPETDNGMLSLFGYDPAKYYTGRGPLEALGAGINFDEGNLAVRCNFGTIRDEKVIDTGAGRIDARSARKLIAAVNRKVRLERGNFRLHYTLNYRSVLILRSNRSLSDQVSNNHPAYRRERNYVERPITKTSEMVFDKVRPLDSSEGAKYSSDLLNEFLEKSGDVLSGHHLNWRRIKKGLHPGNMLLIRGTGNRLPKLEGFNKEQFRWLCIGDTPCERGIAKLLYMDVVDIKDPLCDKLPAVKGIEKIEENVSRDMRDKAKWVSRNLEDYDCFYIHIKGPDPFGHQNSPREKAKVIEAIDKAFMGKLMEMADLDNSLICVTSDHCTSCEKRAHTSDPVPLLISGSWVQKDGTKKFGESSCRKGALRTIKGMKLMSILMEEFRR